MLELALAVTFWVAGVTLVFPYLIYPFVLNWLAKSWGKPVERPSNEDEVPSVTLVVSAFNEEDVIAEKLRNVAALDYPAERLTIVVVSDASSDATDTLVEEAARSDPRIRLHRQAERHGKTAGLNAVVPLIDSDLIVFSDANAMYETQALRELVWPFHDESVGYVVGAALYTETHADGAASREGEFWDFELLQKQREAIFDSVVGGDGAIYTIRRELYWELEDDDINDFVNPLQIVAAGYRGVFSSEARCFEEAADSFDKEFKRKRRIVNRSWRAVLRYMHRISALKRPRFFFCLIAHKVIRWFGAPLVAVQLATAIALVTIGAGFIYAIAAVAIGLSIVAGLLGWALDSRNVELPRAVSIPYYFYLVVIAAWLGVLDQARGVRYATWQHVRKN
jgi:cellulose synthase/poly-beta-1,6-N-acetylglucosamine synthase-like glycosyltransferase